MQQPKIQPKIPELLEDEEIYTPHGFKPYGIKSKLNEIITYLYHLEAQITNLRGGWTDVEIKKASFNQWPQQGDIFYRFNSQGEIIEQVWTNSGKQRKISYFLGIFRTREEAKAYKQKLLKDNEQ